MTHTTARLAVFVEALVASGVRHVCISPGARNTPLSYAFGENASVETWVHHDERSAGFFALGIGKATATPAVVVCTSGTAGTHYLPAITEARYSRTPLIVLTADRPPELRTVGAPQAIDQVKLFGTAVKWAHEAGLSDGATTETAARLGAQVVAASLDTPPGPVHVNFPFRAPLMPDSTVPPTSRTTNVLRGAASLDDHDLAELASSLSGKRGILVAGYGAEHAAAATAAFADAVGWPILADPLSGLRAGPHKTENALAYGDLLAAAGFLDASPPEVVLRVGAIPTSKPLWTWLAANAAVPQILIDAAEWSDPTNSIAIVVRADPAATLRELAKRTEAIEQSHRRLWIEADKNAGVAAHSVIDAVTFPNEPSIAALTGASAPTGSVLFVGSSMPIRDVDSFMAGRTDELRILGNRGANGIDGVLSTALGVSAVSKQRTIVLTGDVGALHDLTALATAARLGLDLVVVIIHNDGGGIFHFLPQVALPRFEEFFGTPHGVDFVAVARAFGVESRFVETPSDLTAAIQQPGPTVVVLRTDRQQNAELHGQIRRAVAEALTSLRSP